MKRLSGMLRLLVLLTLGFASVNAARLRQEPSPLQGKSILFAARNGESSPSDTGADGASELADMLTENGAEVDTTGWASPVPAGTDLIILAGAELNYRTGRTARLWTYLSTGGSVLLLIDPPQDEQSVQEESTLFSLLGNDFGIRTSNGIALNPRQDDLPLEPVESENSEGTPPQIIDQLSSSSPDHPILQGVNVENLVLDGLRPLEMQNTIESVTVSELLVTDDQPYGESDVTTFMESGVYFFDAESDQDRGAIIAAIASENTSTGGRIVVVGDSSIARNGSGFDQQDTARLVLNAIDWLLGLDTSD